MQVVICTDMKCDRNSILAIKSCAMKLGNYECNKLSRKEAEIFSEKKRRSQHSTSSFYPDDNRPEETNKKQRGNEAGKSKFRRKNGFVPRR